MDESIVPPVASHPALAPPVPPTDRDRRGWLLFFGLVEILMGAVCLLLVAGSFLVLAAGLRADAAGPKPTALGLLLNVIIYLGAGTFLVTMGIGTIRAKRWARALMLLTSWPAFLAFLLGGIGMALLMPSFLETLPQTPGQPDMRGVVKVVLLGVFLLLTLVPLSFILFYSRRSVRVTFETRDPAPSWVDGRPLPVLGVVGAVGLYGVFALLGLARGPSYGLFGVLLTGWAAAVALLANLLLCLWLARQLYRMTRSGWWANVAYAVLIHLSAWITLRVIGVEQLIQASGAQAEIAARPGLLEWATRFAQWFTPVSAVVWVLTLVWLRRYHPAGTFSRPAGRVAHARR